MATLGVPNAEGKLLAYSCDGRTARLTEVQEICTYVHMKVVVDTSALLAVVLNEPERRSVIAATKGCDCVAPLGLPFEIGNALSALFKRGRLSASDVLAAWSAFVQIDVALVGVDIVDALAIATRRSIYAYDAYFLECTRRQGGELLTLDRRLQATAKAENLKLRKLAEP